MPALNGPPPPAQRKRQAVPPPLPAPFSTPTLGSPTSTIRPADDDDDDDASQTRDEPGETGIQTGTEDRDTTETARTTTAPSRSSLSSSGSSRATTSSAQRSSTSTSVAHSTVTTSASSGQEQRPNTFPSDFPVETNEPVRIASGGRGYAFFQENELLDSLCIFGAFVVVSLFLTICLIKITLWRSRRQGVKGDQMVGEEMKWAERRVVLDRKIVYESIPGGQRSGSGPRARGGGGQRLGRTPEASAGWRELSESDRSRAKYK